VIDGSIQLPGIHPDKYILVSLQAERGDRTGPGVMAMQASAGNDGGNVFRIAYGQGVTTCFAEEVFLVQVLTGSQVQYPHTNAKDQGYSA
jgi:hypothetical protein